MCSRSISTVVTVNNILIDLVGCFQFHNYRRHCLHSLASQYQQQPKPKSKTTITVPIFTQTNGD